VDHGSVRLIPRIYAVDDYVKLIQLLKNLSIPIDGNLESTCHLPWFSRFQRVVMCANALSPQQLNRFQVF